MFNLYYFSVTFRYFPLLSVVTEACQSSLFLSSRSTDSILLQTDTVFFPLRRQTEKYGYFQYMIHVHSTFVSYYIAESNKKNTSAERSPHGTAFPTDLLRWVRSRSKVSITEIEEASIHYEHDLVSNRLKIYRLQKGSRLVFKATVKAICPNRNLHS